MKRSFDGCLVSGCFSIIQTIINIFLAIGKFVAYGQAGFIFNFIGNSIVATLSPLLELFDQKSDNFESMFNEFMSDVTIGFGAALFAGGVNAGISLVVEVGEKFDFDPPIKYPILAEFFLSGVIVGGSVILDNIS